MADIEEIVRLQKIIPETDMELLGVLLDDAETEVLAQTNRTALIDPLKKTVRDMAVIAWNRMGTEGENSRSEAGESYSFDDMPEHITRVIHMYRLARVGGKTYEKKATSHEEDKD